MFITSQIEFEVAADQLEAYLLIEKPTDEEKIQHVALAEHMKLYVMTQPIDQERMH